MGTELAAERRTALAAVRAASILCRQVRETLTDAHAADKPDSSPVTVADLASQAVICMAISDAFPADPIVGEEDASLLREGGRGAMAAVVSEAVRSQRPDADDERIMAALDRGGHGGGDRGRFWTLDPVDGTKGFLRGEQYAIALALIEDGEVILGVLGCPNLSLDPGHPMSGLGCLFVAERGSGARMMSMEEGPESAIRVQLPAAMEGTRWTGSVEAAHSAMDDAGRVAALLGWVQDPLRMDSQAKYATVARGETQAYLRLPTSETYRERIWDHAAGWLVVTEAGGRVTDANGAEIDFGRGRTLASNRGVIVTAGGDLHSQVLDALARVAGT